MDWNSLVLKNIWHNMRRYLSYLLASTTSVMVFSMFFIFVFNSSVRSLAALQVIAVIMVICLFIVAWFAIFFIFFFHSSLIRMRNKEFGLLMTLGMTPGQIGRLIFVESLCIGAVALVLGMLLGVLGTQPFFWAMEAVLSLPQVIPFELPSIALMITAVFFGIVFLLEACLISWRVARRTPRMLLLGARAQQTPPRPSWIKVVLGLLCLGAAYDMALQFSSSFVLNAIPIVVLTMLGTFLLFSQVMVMLLTFIRKLALHGVNLLIVSRLVYRIKDYARMLAVVTILNACVLTGMGAVYGFLQTLITVEHQTSPVDVFLQENQAHPYAQRPQQLHDDLVARHITVTGQFSLPLVVGQVQQVPISIMSHSSFEVMRTSIVRAHPEYSKGLPGINEPEAQRAYLYTPENDAYFAHAEAPIDLGNKHQIQIQVGGQNFMLATEQIQGRIINANGALPDRVLVLNDQTFQSVQQKASVKERWQAIGFYFPSTQEKTRALTIFQQVLHAPGDVSLLDAQNSLFGIQLFSSLLFAGSFVSLLFLLAAGCALYFKLFMQQDEDRRQFSALARVGLRKWETIRIIGFEFLLLFFLPVLVAVIHSGVASMDLMFLMRVPDAVVRIIWASLGITSLIYAGSFAVYYLIALINYTRRMRIATV